MMPSLPPLTRRSLLAAGTGAFALALAGHGTATASASPGVPTSVGALSDLDYTSPEAFDIAEQAYLDQDAQHNEAGLFAWGESYYLNGLLLMYQAHADEAYLDRLEERIEHVLANTDQARGVTDYAGRSGPGWRAAANYTAGHGELPLSDGAAGIQIRWAGITSHQASATVTATGGGTFELTLEHPSSTVTHTGLSLDPESPDYVVEAINAAFTGADRWTAADHRQSPAAGDELAAGTVAFEPQFYVFSVHTGMIILPMARYVRLVRESPELAGRRARASRVLTAVRRATRFHEGDFAIDDQGRGDFWWPRGAPIPWDGLMQPYNQGQALGTVWAELYRITGSNRYRTRVEAMMTSMRQGLVIEGDAVTWPYWQPWEVKYQGYTADDDLSSYTPHYWGIQVAEDISHAAITLEFLQGVHDAGIEDLSALREQVGVTFTQNVIRDEHTVWRRIDGTEEAAEGHWAQMARWLMLHDVEPEIHDHTLRVYQAGELEPSQGSHALAMAYLNLTA